MTFQHTLGDGQTRPQTNLPIRRSTAADLAAPGGHRFPRPSTGAAFKLKGKMMIEAHDLLKQCLEAFEAIPVAANSRKMLRKLGVVPGVYAGNGSHLLAGVMVVEIRKFLAESRAGVSEDAHGKLQP
jgi:hypothetical protein